MLFVATWNIPSRTRPAMGLHRTANKGTRVRRSEAPIRSHVTCLHTAIRLCPAAFARPYWLMRRRINAYLSPPLMGPQPGRTSLPGVTNPTPDVTNHIRRSSDYAQCCPEHQAFEPNLKKRFSHSRGSSAAQILLTGPARRTYHARGAPAGTVVQVMRI